MEVQVNLDFRQLLKIVRNLPSDELQQLKAEIERNNIDAKSKIDLEYLLLNGPTATQKQLDTILNNRKAVNQWRTKE